LKNEGNPESHSIMNHHACTAYIEYMEGDMRVMVGKVIKELERMEKGKLRKESMVPLRTFGCQSSMCPSQPENRRHGDRNPR